MMTTPLWICSPPTASGFRDSLYPWVEKGTVIHAVSCPRTQHSEPSQHSNLGRSIRRPMWQPLGQRSTGYKYSTMNNSYNVKLTFLRGKGESSGVSPEATSSPLTSTSTRLETSGGWDMIKSIWKVAEAGKYLCTCHKMLSIIHWLGRMVYSLFHMVVT